MRELIAAPFEITECERRNAVVLDVECRPFGRLKQRSIEEFQQRHASIGPDYACTDN
jgi:hypothetical protein